jgi:hypothetical protein
LKNAKDNGLFCNFEALQHRHNHQLYEKDLVDLLAAGGNVERVSEDHIQTNGKP